MHIGWVAENWWLVLAVMALVVVIFVFVAGRGAEGGLRGRASLGWKKWRVISKHAGDVQARVVLTIFYFTLAVPFGLFHTHIADPLDIRSEGKTRRWRERTTRDLTVADARRQF